MAGKENRKDESGLQVQAAEVVLPCAELEATLAFFTERLGFRLEAVFPADAPAVAVVSGFGLRLRLERGGRGAPGVLRLACREPAALGGGARELTAPNGTRIELVEAAPPLVVPPLRPAFVLTRMGTEAAWKPGRAGMLYRDLIPGRQGGRFIASHIRIPEGGPVPDYVHFHKVRFQMIFCHKGWVRVVYEDQGPPRVLEPGDSFLQPPEIRHRVLECSPGLEVIELACPAEHETFADHALALPTAAVRPEREFGGQRFVHHAAAGSPWETWRLEGFEARDTGIGAATKGLAGARVVRPLAPGKPQTVRHEAEFLFFFVLAGGLRLFCEGRAAEALSAGDACVVPAGLAHALADPSDDLELLEVTLPDVLPPRPATRGDT